MMRSLPRNINQNCFIQFCRATLILNSWSSHPDKLGYPKFSEYKVFTYPIYFYILIILLVCLFICLTIQKYLASIYLGKRWDNSMVTALIEMEGQWISLLQISCVVSGKSFHLCHNAGKGNFISWKNVVFIEREEGKSVNIRIETWVSLWDGWTPVCRKICG